MLPILRPRDILDWAERMLVLDENVARLIRVSLRGNMVLLLTEARGAPSLNCTGSFGIGKCSMD